MCVEGGLAFNINTLGVPVGLAELHDKLGAFVLHEYEYAIEKSRRFIHSVCDVS